MKKLLLWLVMVVLMVALLLGGTLAVLYSMAGEKDMPQTNPTFMETELTPNGYEWQIPVLGGILHKEFTQPTNLTVQKLGDLGDTTPTLMPPAWATRSKAVLTAPDGTSAEVEGWDPATGIALSYSKNGEYELVLTLWQDGKGQTPAGPDGWYQYRASFSLNRQPQAALSDTRVSQGSVAAIRVSNILDGSTPALETDLGDVWFRTTKEGFMGYIPVTYNAEGGDHTMTLTCGELTQELTLTVTQAQASTVQSPAQAEIPGAASEYQNAIWPLYTRAAAEKLWSGPFVAPSNAGIQTDYGSILMTDGNRAGRATGITYAAAEGSEAVAPQTGTVVYAGTLALTGGTVVLDHGCGVKSYLFGLDAIAVAQGATLQKGTVVGKVAAGQQLIYELRIGSKSVDPAAAIEGKSALQYREDL